MGLILSQVNLDMPVYYIKIQFYEDGDLFWKILALCDHYIGINVP